jgi:RimJ/RimL family protein N-acetyltransferase
MKLIPIERGGVLGTDVGDLPTEAASAVQATAELYEKVGFVPPWICYIATQDARAVGTCGFTSAPKNGRVEIAYFTFPGFEGRGIATVMAASLILLATDYDLSVTLIARTLLERNASHRVLEKHGFTCMGRVEVPEDGTVFEWQRFTDRVA